MSASSWATASGSPSLWPCCSVGIALCGMWIALSPALWAPQMSSKSRSPTYTHAAGSPAPTASMAARKASGAGFVHGTSLV